MNDIVLTTYLTQHPDPQRGTSWKVNDSCIVKRWIDSLTRCGLRGVIFHDDLSIDFCEDWAGNVEFRQVHWKTSWAATEERMCIYLEAILNGPWDRVLTTDLQDVEFYRDPFPLMEDRSKLYIGSNPWTVRESRCVSGWMRDRFGEAATDLQVLNPGILGGERQLMIRFLGELMREMSEGKPGPGLDLAAANRLIRRGLISYQTGPPLHTQFMADEGPGSDCAIRHK